MKNYEKLLKGVKTLAVSCRQWGDTGKGKFSDIFADWADIIARGTGGDNAGHTICCKGQELVTHVIPSGIIYDSEGKINIIGSGVVVYPKSLIRELNGLEERELSYNNLRLAFNAKLITPAEIVLDRVREIIAGEGKIGSTGKGIGPCYTDFVDRQGLVINDLLNPDFFWAKLQRHLDYKRAILRNLNREMLKKIMAHPHLEDGLYYDQRNIFNAETIFGQYVMYGQILRDLVSDTDAFVKSQLGVQNILAEGSQGDLLSIKHGTYPYVTSSDCTVGGLAQGIGLKESDIDLSLGIIKGFYMTRVGNGPFPTERGAKKSDDWCNGGKANREMEDELYGNATVNDEDEFLQGVALRRAGNEYGATTKRPRRVGWLDLPLLRYVLGFNQPNVILTKLDVLNDCRVIKICNHYEYQGPLYYLGDQTIKPGDCLYKAIPAAEILQYCKPVYTSFPGWQRSLAGCSRLADLPGELRDILRFVTDQTRMKPRIISIGADREETIFI